MYVFFENSQQDLIPGLHNPYDYRYRPFGAVIQAFREANPELWEEAKEAAEMSSAAMQEVIELMDAKRKEIVQSQSPQVEIKRWQKIMSRILQISPPEQEVTSIEMFDFIGALPAEKRQSADQAYWEKAEAFTRVFKILAPELEAAGINPLDTCV